LDAELVRAILEADESDEAGIYEQRERVKQLAGAGETTGCRIGRHRFR
jgi:hypothetical protein